MSVSTVDKISSMLSALGRSSANLNADSTLADVQTTMSEQGFFFPSSAAVLIGELCEQTHDLGQNVQTNIPVHMAGVHFGPIEIDFSIDHIPEGICIGSVRVPGECHFEFCMSDPIFSLEKVVEASMRDGLFSERNNYVRCGPKTVELLKRIYEMHGSEGQTFLNIGKPYEEFINIAGFAELIV